MRITGRVDLTGASPEARKAVRAMVLEEVKDAITQIITRTLSGRDVNGRKFVKYTKEYARFKRRTTGSRTVNLKLTGQMLGSISSKIETRSQSLNWSIFFSNEEAEKKAMWNSARRPFFGVSRLTLGRIRIRSSALLRYYKGKDDEQNARGSKSGSRKRGSGDQENEDRRT